MHPFRRAVGVSSTAALLISSLQLVAVFAAPMPPIVNLSDLDGRSGFVLNGIDANDLSGQSVSSAGDINDDGVDDLIIGSDTAGTFDAGGPIGEAYVVFGETGVGNLEL